MAQFATAEELAALLRTTFDASESVQADSILTLASGVVQGHLRQTVRQVVGDVLVRRGTWDTRFRLPERPVTAVSVVSIGGTALTADDWYLQGDELVRTVGWGGPSVEVSVTYTHGYATIPDDIKAVVLQSAVRAWSNPSGIAQESLEGYSITYARGNSGVVLFESEKAILDRYRRTNRTVQIR